MFYIYIYLYVEYYFGIDLYYFSRMKIFLWSVVYVEMTKEKLVNYNYWKMKRMHGNLSHSPENYWKTEVVWLYSCAIVSSVDHSEYIYKERFKRSFSRKSLGSTVEYRKVRGGMWKISVECYWMWLCSVFFSLSCLTVEMFPTLDNKAVDD